MRSCILILSILALLMIPVRVHAEMSIAIVSHQDGDFVTPCVDFDVVFDVQTGGETIKDVRLYSNGSLKGRVRTAPWQYTWRNMAGGVYRIQAQVTATDETEAWSDLITLRAGSVSRGEKVYNGNFDCGTTLTPWNMNVNATNGAVATGEVIEELYFDDVGYMFIEITNRGSADWHVQFQQPIPVDSGHVYNLTFLADADDKKLVRITMQENQDPWFVQWTQEVTIDGADEYGPFEFIAERTDPSNYIRFNLGEDVTPVYLDKIRLVDQSMTSVKSMELRAGLVQEYELSAAYPNPFNMNTAIPFSLSRTAEIKLSIYDMLGRLVKNLFTGEKGPGHFQLQWDGTDEAHHVVPSGLYFYQLSINDGRRSPVQLMRKVVLMK
ncbi:carbohydrate binding domain-containing protein [candidate division KSB1 bacterium]|nr:carbohydrate binding domain-containing protein [candidate division KSB1 bacterium]